LPKIDFQRVVMNNVELDCVLSDEFDMGKRLQRERRCIRGIDNM